MAEHRQQSRLVMDMWQNDRVCISIQGQTEPYNIVRMLRVDETSPPAASIYLSLLKDSWNLLEGDAFEGHLSGNLYSIRLERVGSRFMGGSYARLVFEGSEDIRFKRLQRKGSVRD